jgi:hypothetical protein
MFDRLMQKTDSGLQAISHSDLPPRNTSPEGMAGNFQVLLNAALQIKSDDKISRPRNRTNFLRARSLIPEDQNDK